MDRVVVVQITFPLTSDQNVIVIKIFIFHNLESRRFPSFMSRMSYSLFHSNFISESLVFMMWDK